MDVEGDMGYLDLEQQGSPKRKSGMISTIRRGFRMRRLSEEYPSSWVKGKVLDPEAPFLQLWNKIFALSCIVALSLDPLFFYIPISDNNRKCLDFDNKLKIIVCILRSLTDFCYMLHILVQFCTGYIAPSSRLLQVRVLIENFPAIAKRYLSSYFIVDIFSVLPLPQVVILIIAPRVKAPLTRKLLMVAIFSQYIPRLFQMFSLYRRKTRDSRIFPYTPWAGAAFNLFLYMQASNVLGAFWYLFSIERVDACWRTSCANNDCDIDTLYCGVPRIGNYSFLSSSCVFVESSGATQLGDFDFGIFLEALQAEVVEKQMFWQKFFQCFWWGLRNLSSMGQNLNTSKYIWENVFAISISVMGLVLFALLIGNMQKYLQSISVRLDDMKAKRRDRRKIEQWMSHRVLPENIRRRVRRYQQYKWQGTRGIQEDALIKNLPKDLRRDINRHHWALLTRVPVFSVMDDVFKDALCSHLKPVLYTENSYIYLKGDPVDEMLFLIRGNISSIDEFPTLLRPGDFCGEELVSWAFSRKSNTRHPTSTRVIKAITDVEAFSLKADDLRFVASQFKSLNNELRHVFRFYSQQWRTWAACYIQAAWRRFLRRKMEKLLHVEQRRTWAAFCIQAAWRRYLRRKSAKSLRGDGDRGQAILAGGNSTSLAVTAYAS